MCGICGIFSRDGIISMDNIKQMTKVLEHRGPDNEGFYSDDLISLGHRRLKIIALESGDQPIHNEDCSIHVIFNGEIYNYKSLRERLVQKGHRFYTESDTEVLVHLYEEYGTSYTNHLDGDFAIALWDARNKKLILSRDKIGVKPLYYHYSDGTLIFASEIKSIIQIPIVKRIASYNSIFQYLTYSFVPSPITMFDGINKIPAGHTLIVDSSGISVHKYWDLNYSEEIKMSITSENMILFLLENAVRKRLMSDVPLGAFLSGGVDSSLVVALMRKIDSETKIMSYTVGYDEEEYSELKYARLVSEMYETDHRELVIGSDDYWNALPNFAWSQDEPSISESGVAFQILSKFASPNIRVALCGEGSDEVFAGYYGYSWYTRDRFNIFQKTPLSNRKIFSPIFNLYIRSRKRAYPPVEDSYFGSATSFVLEDKRKLFTNNSKTEGCQIIKTPRKFKNDLHQMMYIDFKTWLPDSLLMVEDKMGMSSSIEGRVPFLDCDLIDYASRLDNSNRINGGEQKWLIRKIAKKYIPSPCLDRKKMGFSTPLSTWMRKELYDDTYQIVLDGAKSRGILDSEYIEKIFHIHRSGSENLTHKIWLLLNLELWFRTFIDADCPVEKMKKGSLME